MIAVTPRVGALMLVVAARRVLAHHPESAIHAAADKHLTQMTVAVSYAFLKGRKAYKAGGVDSAVKAIHDALLQSLPPVLLKVAAAGGSVALSKLGKRRAASLRTLKPHSTTGPFGLAFNVDDPRAIAWAEDHAGELAKGLSDTSEQAIRDAIAEALAGDGIDAAYDEILAAVGDSDRAAMIARTEVMWAAHEGQQQAWEQAVENGLLPDDARVEWIATSGCCDDCDAMDGTTRPIDGEYDGDYADGPPGHPNCRCTEGIAA